MHTNVRKPVPVHVPNDNAPKTRKRVAGIGNNR